MLTETLSNKISSHSPSPSPGRLGVRRGKHNMAKSNLNITYLTARENEIRLEEDVIMTVGDFTIQQQLIRSAEEAMELPGWHTIRLVNGSSSEKPTSTASHFLPTEDRTRNETISPL